MPSATRSVSRSIWRKHAAAKPLKGFGGVGDLGIVEDDEGGTYRAVYTVRFADAVYVLHAFQKKSKSGIATAKSDLHLIRLRLKAAETRSRAKAASA